MSKLTFLNLENLSPPREGAPVPERVLTGAPTFLTWDGATSGDRKVRTGVWEVTPGSYKSTKDTFEFCYILSGVSYLVEDGYSPRRIAAGDAFVLHPGYQGVWQVEETTRKMFVVYEG